jgi:hypothetical protein
MLLENLNDPNIQAILEAQGHASYASRVEEKERILKIITKHILIDAPRSLIEELKDGLQTLGILDSIIQYPEQFREMFTSEKIKPLDAQSVDLLFRINYADHGSNKRASQERAIVYWRDYLQDCQRKFILCDNSMVL